MLQHLDPRDHAFGEGLPDVLLNAIVCPVHAILRQWPVIPLARLTTVMRASGGGDYFPGHANLHEPAIKLR